MHAAAVEGVIRPLLADAVEKLLLGQRIDAVVAQDVVPLAGDGGEGPADARQVGLLGRDRVGGIDQVAQLDDEGGPVGGELAARLGELAQRFAVVARARRRAIGIMQIGNQAERHGGRARPRPAGGGRGRRAAGCCRSGRHVGRGGNRMAWSSRWSSGGEGEAAARGGGAGRDRRTL